MHSEVLWTCLGTAGWSGEKSVVASDGFWVTTRQSPVVTRVPGAICSRFPFQIERACVLQLTIFGREEMSGEEGTRGGC